MKSQWIWLGLILGRGRFAHGSNRTGTRARSAVQNGQARWPGARPGEAYLLVRAICRVLLGAGHQRRREARYRRRPQLLPRAELDKVPDYRDGAATNGPDIDDNFEGSMDVNNDGRMDVLSSGLDASAGHLLVRESWQAGQKWDLSQNAQGRRPRRHGDRQPRGARGQGRAGELLRAQARAEPDLVRTSRPGAMVQGARARAREPRRQPRQRDRRYQRGRPEGRGDDVRLVRVAGASDDRRLDLASRLVVHGLRHPPQPGRIGAARACRSWWRTSTAMEWPT